MITVLSDKVRFCTSVISTIRLAEDNALNNILSPSISYSNSPLYELLFFRIISSPKQTDTTSNMANTFPNICFLVIYSP